MSDISTVNQLKPMWPKRHDEKSGGQDKSDDEENKEEISGTQKGEDDQSHPNDYDGQIDEYV